LDKAGLGVNDTCQRLITNLKMHFCQWQNTYKCTQPTKITTQ